MQITDANIIYDFYVVRLLSFKWSKYRNWEMY